MDKKQIFSIPNILSFIRILLIPVFILVYIRAQTLEDFYTAAFIIVLSGITDWVDGFIARRFNMITDIGKVLDPLADKLTQTSIAICLAIKIEGMWLLLSIFIIKEILMIIAGGILIGKGVKLEGAKWFGKLATAVFYVVMFIVVAIPSLSKGVLNGLIVLSAVFMVFAFVMYIPEFLYHIKNKSRQ